MIIETAMDGNADFIVTGESHLLALKIFRGINVTTGKNARLHARKRNYLTAFA
jgi:predicted nucleic acid-binding protein